MIVLCGAQHAQPSLPRVLRELGVTGSVAMITAGWQEREGEVGLVADPGVPLVELNLHARGEQVFAADAELAEGYKARQLRLKLMQDFYRIRIEYAWQAARGVAVRSADPQLLAEELGVSFDLMRYIDRDHVERCKAVHAAFEAKYQPGHRPVVHRHLQELRAAIAPTQAIVIAGGHVAVLLNRLRLFDIAGLAGDRPIVAWSAGAMALTDRIVLFHEDPPHGQAISEVLECGLGLASDLVVLPEPRLRLSLEDGVRVGELARRYAPAQCVALDHGAQIWVDGPGLPPAGSAEGPRGVVIGGRAVRGIEAQRLDASGEVHAINGAWPGGPS